MRHTQQAQAQAIHLLESGVIGSGSCREFQNCGSVKYNCASFPEIKPFGDKA
jgi:hypothetical protein